MVWWKLFKCFPGRSRKQNPRVENRDDDDYDYESDSSDGGFTARQKAKAVAVVLSGYDPEIAAASISCDVEVVKRWVRLYRPPFFEDGMKCPPALITWWMRELERKEDEFSDAVEEQPDEPAGDLAAPSSNVTVTMTNPNDENPPSSPPAQVMPVEPTPTTSADVPPVAVDKVPEVPEVEDVNANTSDQNENVTPSDS